MHLIYNILLAIAFVVSIPFFLWKGRGSGKYRKTFRERSGQLPPGLNPHRQRSIWIHAVSVGEVLAARTLVRSLRERFPGHRVVLSTTTVTGNAVAQKHASEVDALFFAPFDFPAPVRAAFDVVKPELLVLVETELWPNLIREARKRGTRVALVNGRISPRSFPRYRAIRAFMGPVLEGVDLFLMQGPAHAERVLAMGAPKERVRALGNLKFDALQAPAPSERLTQLLGTGLERPVWVAGSTVGGEEEIVLRTLRLLRERVPEAALIVAPRHPERFGLVPPLVEAAGLRCLRRTSLEPGAWRGEEVVLLDTLGELAQVYSLASVVFVGGSLVPAGGHNILEPAVAGKPVVVGPHMENFQEIADEFRAAGGMLQVASEEELAREITGLFTDAKRRHQIGERGRGLVEQNRGALAHTLDALAGLLA